MNLTNLIDLIKYPIITTKATILLEFKQYSFAVAPRATKTDIKIAIEYLFKVKVDSVNTCNRPPKTRRVGKFVGNRTSYKKAIVTLAADNSIDFFSVS